MRKGTRARPGRRAAGELEPKLARCPKGLMGLVDMLAREADGLVGVVYQEGVPLTL